MTTTRRPTFRLIRHRLAGAYGWLFTLSGIQGLVSGALVLSVLFATCWKLSSSPWKWEVFALCAIAALAYCVPWGAFSATVEPDEEPFL